MELTKLNLAGQVLNGSVSLPLSKSESNRALLLQALSRGRVQIAALSDAEDTVIMQRLLNSDDEVLDAGDAGTVMRFLTAYYAFQPQDVMLTGSARMKERPIALLVDALRQLGADIFYPEREGYPPLAIYGRNAHFGESHVRIPGNVSSQYLSALIMIAPLLPDGLILDIEGPLTSAPYLEMTMRMMAACGVTVHREEGRLRVERQNFSEALLQIEADWSAAAYFYCMLALAPAGRIHLKGLKAQSLQGDAVIATWMEAFGIRTLFDEAGAWIEKQGEGPGPAAEYDFTGCPDLAQGLIVLLAARRQPAVFSGLHSLRIKETDRIAALDAELKPFGMRLEETQSGRWELKGHFRFPSLTPVIHTYGDHRMAMAFAQLGLKGEIAVENAEVVKKSFPGFWNEINALRP